MNKDSIQKPSEVIKEYIDNVMNLQKIPTCGIEAVDLLAKHVAKLAAHADAVDNFLDIAFGTCLPKQ